MTVMIVTYFILNNAACEILGTMPKPVLSVILLRIQSHNEVRWAGETTQLKMFH